MGKRYDQTMTEDLLDRLTRVGTRHQKLRRDEKAVREELAALVLEAAQAGIEPVEIARRSGYSADRVRVIRKDAGLDPLPTGRRAVGRSA